MRNPGGYGVTTYADKGRVEEEDTITCSHCNAIVVVLPPGTHLNEAQAQNPLVVTSNNIPWCQNCFKGVCRRCGGGPCTPFMKKVELAEKRAQQRRALG